MIEQNQFKTASLLVKLGNAVTYYRNLKMENLDLTSVQSDAFIATLRNPGITASQLKDCLQLSQSTTAGIIARLENKRLITKTLDKEPGSQEGLKLDKKIAKKFSIKIFSSDLTIGIFDVKCETSILSC